MPVLQKKALFSAFIICQVLRIIQNYMEVSPAKSLILSATIHGGSYFFIQPRICERYEPCKIAKITPCKFTCKGVYFCYFIGRQRGTLFPRCAWRNILFRTQFSWFNHIFTTNSWKNIFVWFSYHILRQRLMVYTTAGTVSGRFILDISFSTWDFSAIWL